MCVPKVDVLRERILVEARDSRYIVYSSSTNMYHDLKEIYWWNNIKRDMAKKNSKCIVFQQVKVKHLRPGMSQEIGLPLLKWEIINMYFVMGHCG